MDDAELALRCAAREEAPWRELLGRAGPLSESVIRRVLKRAGVPNADREAGELMGNWALALLEKEGKLLRDYRPEAASLPTYLAVVARSVAFRHLKRFKPPLSLDPDREPPAPGAGPGADAERIREAMARLEPRDRLLLRLVYWDHAGPEEAARALGLAPGSIGPLLTRARAEMEALLGKIGK